MTAGIPVLDNTPEIRPASELKPCPFCGKLPFIGRNDEAETLVACTGWRTEECHVAPDISGAFPTPLIKAWNTRPLEDADRARIAKQAEEIERLENVILRAECEEGNERDCSRYCGDEGPLHQKRREIEEWRAALSKPEPGR